MSPQSCQEPGIGVGLGGVLGSHASPTEIQQRRNTGLCLQWKSRNGGHGKTLFGGRECKFSVVCFFLCARYYSCFILLFSP